MSSMDPSPAAESSESVNTSRYRGTIWLNTCHRRAFPDEFSRADEPIAAFAAGAHIQHYEESWLMELFQFAL